MNQIVKPQVTSGTRANYIKIGIKSTRLVENSTETVLRKQDDELVNENPFPLSGKKFLLHRLIARLVKDQQNLYGETDKSHKTA